MRYPNVTWRIILYDYVTYRFIWLLIYHWTTTHLYFQNIFEVTCTYYISTLCLKKVPTFKLSVTLSNLNRFSKFLHFCKAYEMCYKRVRQYPSHLRHVAAPPWEIKNSNFLQVFSRCVRKCKQIAYLSLLTLLMIHEFWYFRCLK